MKVRLLGNTIADLWVGDRVVIELKAAQTLVTRHEVQLVNYLAATGMDCGLLLNFRALSSSEAQVPRIQAENLPNRIHPVNLVILSTTFFPIKFTQESLLGTRG